MIGHLGVIWSDQPMLIFEGRVACKHVAQRTACVQRVTLTVGPFSMDLTYLDMISYIKVFQQSSKWQIFSKRNQKCFVINALDFPFFINQENRIK